MTAINKNEWPPQAIASAFLFVGVLVGVFLLPPSGFCADADTQAIVEEAAEKAAEKAVEKATGKAVEKAAEKAAEKAIEKAAAHTSAEFVERAAERAVERAAEETAAAQELMAKRPDEWRGPTKVRFLVFVLDIDAIDDANQSFTSNVYVRLRWKDRRLANPKGSTRQIRLEEVWNPQVILANRQGLVSRSLPDVVHVEPDGTVTYRQRYTGMLSQPLQLANFPMDKHTFTIHFASAAYGAKELDFVPDTSDYDSNLIGGSMAGELSLPDWNVLGFEILALPYEPIEEIKAAGFALRFEAERYVKYYYWQVLIPLSVVVMMSWAGFWIQRGQVGVRIGVATSSILTMIAHRFVLASLLPRLPYMTRMDYFSVACTVLVFLALTGVVLTGYLAAINRDLIAKRVDTLARSLFPASFLLLLIWFVWG